MLASLFLFGEKMVGYIKKILVGGSSGIADISWDEEYQMKTKDK